MRAVALLRRRRLLPVSPPPCCVSSSSSSCTVNNRSNIFKNLTPCQQLLSGWRCRRPPWNHSFSSWQPWKALVGEDTMEISGNVAELGSTNEEGSAILSSSGLSSMVDEATTGDSFWYLPLIRPIIYMLDGFHHLTGLPWWVVIITSTLVFRTALLPLLVLQLKKLGEIAVLLPKLPPPLPPPQSGRSFREQYLIFLNKRRELGCPSFLWNFAFFTIQFPCFFLWMISIRRMCLDHHPGFDNGGTLWFQNLTDLPQSVLGSIFPISIATLHYINIQISFKGSKILNMRGILGILAKYYKLYLDILAIPLLLIGFHIPQGSLVYWATNSMLSSAQILSLKNSYIRKKLGLPEEKNLKKNTLEHDERFLIKNRTSAENTLHESSTKMEHKMDAETHSPEDLLSLALGYFAAGHLDEALPLLRLATEKDPELIRAWIAMGEIYCSKGLLEESAEYFEHAISKIKDESQEEDLNLLVLALFGAGFSRIQQGRKLLGIEHLKRIAELKEPQDAMNKVCYYRGLVLLGSQLFNDGEKSEAASYLRRAAAYDPAVNAMVKECEG